MTSERKGIETVTIDRSDHTERGFEIEIEKQKDFLQSKHPGCKIEEQQYEDEVKLIAHIKDK